MLIFLLIKNQIRNPTQGLHRAPIFFNSKRIVRLLAEPLGTPLPKPQMSEFLFWSWSCPFSTALQFIMYFFLYVF